MNILTKRALTGYCEDGDLEIDNNLALPRAAVAALCRLPDYAAPADFRILPPAFQWFLTRHNHIASPEWQACRNKERLHDDSHVAGATGPARWCPRQVSTSTVKRSVPA